MDTRILPLKVSKPSVQSQGRQTLFRQTLFRQSTVRTTQYIFSTLSHKHKLGRNWKGSRRCMHVKHGIDRGTEVTEGSGAWGGYPGGSGGCPLLWQSYNVCLHSRHYCTAPDFFGIWFGVFPIFTSRRSIQLQSAIRCPDCGLSE